MFGLTKCIDTCHSWEYVQRSGRELQANKYITPFLSRLTRLSSTQKYPLALPLTMSSNRNHPFSHIPPLLALSAEIRNQIYDYLCHRAAPIHLSFYHDTESNTPKPVIPFASNITIPTALFLTCRQINAEASSVFYSTNTFFINRRTKFATL